LLDRYGDDVVDAAIAELKRRAARQMREKIAGIADGVYEGEAFVDSDGVVDAPLRIAMRVTKSGGSDAERAALTFDMTDEFCPWNAGRWRLEVSADGRGTLSASEADPELTLDTADLAATYLGTFTFADLARAGRVRECSPGALAQADRLFSTTTSPWSSTMF